ncbi:unnamed protein product [Calypogeia fissa]
MMEFIQFFIIFILLVAITFVRAEISVNTIESTITASEVFTQSDDSNNLYGSCGTRKCTTHEHLEPHSTQEVSEILLKLNAAGRPFKLRATRRGYHSPNGFVCSGTTSDAKFATGGNKGLKNGDSGTHSVTLLMHRMNHFVMADHAGNRITVEAGMTLQNLADAAVGHGMSVPVGVMPVYGNLTVSGVLAVSAHGTGAGVDSSLADLVTKVTWVDGKGSIITSDSADETGRSQIRGLIGGVGLIGVLCEVTFQFLPAGALAQVEIWTKDDSTIASDVKLQLESQTPHILYFWRPDLRYYRAYFYKPLKSGDTPVHPYYPRGRGAILQRVPDIVAKLYLETIAASQADIDDSSPAADAVNEAVCALSHGTMNLPIWQDGEGNIIENATIPTSHAMLAEECEPNCVWGKFFGSTVEDNEFTIRLSDLDEWVRDVKAIVKGEEAERQKQFDKRYGKGKVAPCMGPGFFWLRFGKPSENLLAIPSGMNEPVVYAMMTFYTSLLTPNSPPKHDHIQEVIEQLSLCKYRARTHFGKNYDRIFTNEKCPLLDNFPEQNLLEMRKLQAQHDPQKVFESELLTRVLEKRGPIYEDKCALTHRCYCKEDSHCADGFKCQPSVVFPEYKVCKVQFSSSSHEEINARDEL